MKSGAPKVGLGGMVAVYCIHQRQKRVVDELEFNRRVEFLQLCPCCENLFTIGTDVPHFCQQCSGREVPQGGLLQLPRGVK